ncbi:type I-E CRISPR-associated protein Cas5/CasD [Candidatus Synechococcus calcipolaris G9]|uniref:Type I-E CRISPR-associated protein Cas5/CasD n=1 Tax=Candidatus Synechococcus calcipolaris G9 TaxID=1497997 RepID=A0ABT6F1A6_9SYNE|nr:type I-E CRISPR-associated protein Cas5/CasD [Candidatus Synechococcus calcipolaris]MDG2991561.1 type I-E CRISPR-associated protein Cas5/CasD [Candidatus Synechococcus calcipolaris G9]
MPTLLMRLRSPMMSWGDHSQFGHRDSRREPTKSAVIGLICAALGRPRWEPVGDLAALKMGIRVNKEGVLQRDYHTVQDNMRDDGSKVNTTLSDRYYVADADYLVGLEGDVELLNSLDAALQTPHWQLYFGRKSFIPSHPVRMGIVEQPLLLALQTAIYEHRGRKDPPFPLRFVLEADGGTDTRQDVPLDWQRRRFGHRTVTTTYHSPEAVCTFPS